MHRLTFRLAALILVALSIRLGFAYLYVAGHPARALSTIPFLFEPGNIAYSLATGHGFSSPFRVETGPTAWMTPVYPLLLSGIFRLFGTYTLNAYLAAAGFNIVCSSLTVVPIYLAAHRIAGTTTAILAALFWAVFPNAILLPYESLWDASLSALLLASLLAATLSIAESRRRPLWALYGLLWGLALMTNAAFVSLLPFLLGWAEYRARRAGIAAIVIVLCCLPWTVRNYLVFHQFVPLRSVAGLALWLGNNDLAGGTAVGNLHPISNQAEREKYIERGEIAYMRDKQNLALAWMLAHPADEARLMAGRFSALWIGGTAAFRTPRFYFVVLFNLFAFTGAIVGIALLWRDRNPCALPLTAIPMVFPLVYYLALAPPRYRHPIDSVLILLAAFALTHLSKYKRQPALRKS